MLTLISPAKSLDLESPLPTRKYTLPRLLDEAELLIEVMRTKAPEDLAELMRISSELAQINAERYARISTPFTPDNSRPAIFTFAGDVYRGLNAAQRFDARDHTEAQKTLRILSGLYGLLRPLDLMQPYRLEMGTSLATERGHNLYRWWGDQITDLVIEDLAASPGPDVVINLASAEYSTAVDLDGLDARVVAPRFEDRNSRGQWKVISFSAKVARGLMAGWIVQNRVRSVRALEDFDEGGYQFVPEVSRPDMPVFRRVGARGASGKNRHG
ncbi:peroxide stress protein YaaA [Dermatophilus congolensis]|uniref:peroxide stress protein YaaA n=1 Tax=Dermatophilus congolensis TaxID=1863 RepID=UPI001AAEC777|nr:peroxide stress protein YaaA [Dermatophilus congolensis]MBO3131263.1 peroxide stress protein YaaA [Dermatophilus congolensis]MBO3134581.1 peroxide stress protein YaaA [Dermatophilus congolensis]MBO3136818.1 peroxide stress protein YaaA [Dermatophilus congolensis]MBO3139062.1 peroxide stress protein YaaA [Dermatophilus congolensis]